MGGCDCVIENDKDIDNNQIEEEKAIPNKNRENTPNKPITINKFKTNIKNIIENIRSSYNTKNLFSYINEKTKLKLIKYNKILQKKLDINIDNYSLFSRRYIIYENKNEGKEFNWNYDLIYEGEFLNGERNGKGKEYNCFGDMTFKGEYLNGKKWNGKGYKKYQKDHTYEIKEGKGSVKEYNCYFNILYEGEYLRGERNGNGKEYNKSNYLLEYEGEYLNGLRNGKGKKYDNQGKLLFDGEFFKGKRWTGKVYDTINNTIYELKNGKGFIREYYDEYNLSYENMLYEGEYLNGERHGKAKIYKKNASYERDYFLMFEGEFKNGKMWSGKRYNSDKEIVYELKDGKGYIKEDYDGIKYVGEYLNGEKNGKGKEYYYDGSLQFEGSYLNGKRNGEGKEYEKSKLIFKGQYLEGEQWNGYQAIYDYDELIFEGELINHFKRKGKEYYKGKLVFEGEYLANRKWTGITYDEDGKIIYKIFNGKGKAREYKRGTLKFEGEYLYGLRNGKGKEFDFYTGNVEFEGEYLNGMKILKKGVNYSPFINGINEEDLEIKSN